MFLNEIPTDWQDIPNTPLGDPFSRMNFGEHKNYHQMLKHKGQPYNEDEINELQARILHKLRRFSHDFYGPGSTRENEGFKIVGNGTANDFMITGGINAHPTGDSLRDAGRIFLDGYQIVFYNEVEMGVDTFEEMIGDRAFSVLRDDMTPPRGVGTLTTPTGDRVDEVYLEFQLHPATRDAVGEHADWFVDAELENPDIDNRTISMAAKNWTIRVVEGGVMPETAYNVGGSGLWVYRLKLAEIHRKDGVAAIMSGDVVDFRLNRWWKEHGPNGEHFFDVPGFAFQFIQNIFRAVTAGLEGNFGTRYEYDPVFANGIDDLSRWVMTNDGEAGSESNSTNFRGEGSCAYNANGDLEEAISYFGDTYGFEAGTPPVAAMTIDSYTYDAYGNLAKAVRVVTLETHTFFQSPFDF